MIREKCYWIGVVSRDHILHGVEGGFVQLNHGKSAPFQKMKAGDGLIIYSPRESHPKGAALQAFTAIGKVATGEVYVYNMTNDFKPHRLDIEFYKCEETPVKTLIPELTFITNKTHWGGPFKLGYLKVTEQDFKLISKAMGCAEFEEDISAE